MTTLPAASSSTTTTTTGSGAGAATAAALAADVLQPGQVGAGWQQIAPPQAPPSGQDPFGGPDSLIPGCLTHAVTGGMAAETEEVLAAGSTLSSDITEAVAVGQAPRVTASEATLASEMDRCARKPPPGGVAGKIEAVVMATVGQRSGAWQQKVQTGPSDLSLLVVAARQGDVLLLMAFGDEGTPNVAADRSLAASSLRDLAPLAG